MHKEHKINKTYLMRKEIKAIFKSKKVGKYYVTK